MADKVLVNSLYTQSVYKNSYTIISYLNHTLPNVLYPCVDLDGLRALSKYILFFHRDYSQKMRVASPR